MNFDILVGLFGFMVCYLLVYILGLVMYFD